jgi:hypothetical protein
MLTGRTPSTEMSGDSDGKPPLVPPTIALPKGGGAIRGIGEKFAANPVTGTGSISVPIATSPGRTGFAPQLSLSYDSGAGNGPFGFGVPCATTCTSPHAPIYGSGPRRFAMKPDPRFAALGGPISLIS